MGPRLRKATLTLHVTCSAGWLGAVATFLALAATGWRSTDPATIAAVYLAAKITTWLAIVPLAAASLLTGIAQSLATPWGLLRHYWVLAKIWLSTGASLLLALHTHPISRAASIAAADPHSPELGMLKTQLAADAAAALLVLCAITALSVFKPRGLTRHGHRRLHPPSAAAA